MRSTIRIALAGSAVVAGVAFASPAFAADAPYPLPPSTGPTVSQSEVQEGSSILFSAGGFEPETTVTIRVSDGRSFTAVADIDGRISVRISFAKAGTYTITASGVDFFGAPRVVSSVVTVTGASGGVVPVSADGNNGTSGSGSGSNGASGSSDSGSSNGTTSTASNSSDVGGLPFTGMELGAVAALGAVTMIGGAAVRVVARRRSSEA